MKPNELKLEEKESVLLGGSGVSKKKQLLKSNKLKLEEKESIPLGGSEVGKKKLLKVNKIKLEDKESVIREMNSSWGEYVTLAVGD